VKPLGNSTNRQARAANGGAGNREADSLWSLNAN